MQHLGAGSATGRLMGEAGSKPEPVPWSGAGGDGQLGVWLGVKGRGAKNKDAEFAARAATNLLEIRSCWHQPRIGSTKFDSKFRISQPVSPRNTPSPKFY